VKVDLSIEQADPDQFDAWSFRAAWSTATRCGSTLRHRVREDVRRGRQTDRGLSATACGDDRSGRRPGPDRDVMAVTQDRLEECGREVGRPRSGRRQELRDSRKPDDIPAYNDKAITLFAKRRAAIGGVRRPNSRKGICLCSRQMESYSRSFRGDHSGCWP